MKRAILCLLALSLLLTGCSSGISQADYDAVVAERDKALEQIKTLNEKLEAAVDISEGTVLIDGSWENGSVKVVAPDDTTLWIQVVDDRPYTYKDMGTVWNLRLEYGEPIETEFNGHTVHNIPYKINLRSPAYSESGVAECDLGNWPWYYEKHMRTLWLAKTIMYEDGSHLLDPDVYIDHEIERTGNTYTATVSLPEWFDVSAVNDLTCVAVELFDASFWHDLAENGSASTTDSYTFKP